MKTNQEIYYKIGKNTKKLIDATELYNQLLTFLYEERKLTSFKTKIGTFQYEDWTHSLYAILETDKNNVPDIYFQEIDNETNKIKKWKYHRLTDMCFGFDFAFAKINIDYTIIKELYKILSEKDKEVYDTIYDEIHGHFW